MVEIEPTKGITRLTRRIAANRIVRGLTWIVFCIGLFYVGILIAGLLLQLKEWGYTQ